MPVILWVCAAVCALAMLALLTAVCVSAGREYALRESDCIIVLGAHVWMDGELSDSLRYRCESALAAWEAGVAPAVIVCGGQGADEPETEAAAMARWLAARGVPEAALFLDETSVNTRQNLENARAIMAAHGFKAAAVCTSDYHLRRALWIARDAGLDACGIAAPSPKRLVSFIRGRLRESCSWALYFLRKL